MSGRVTRRWRQDDQSLMVRMHHSREHFALALRRTGFPEAAEHALRVLPDPANGDQIAAFLAPYGITLDELVSRMGGHQSEGYSGRTRATIRTARSRSSGG